MNVSMQTLGTFQHFVSYKAAEYRTFRRSPLHSSPVNNNKNNNNTSSIKYYKLTKSNGAISDKSSVGSYSSSSNPPSGCLGYAMRPSASRREMACNVGSMVKFENSVMTDNSSSSIVCFVVGLDCLDCFKKVSIVSMGTECLRILFSLAKYSSTDVMLLVS